jgi:hypothetical protein
MVQLQADRKSWTVHRRIAGGAGGPVSLILLPDLVNLGVVEVDMLGVDMLGVDLVGLLVYVVRNDEETAAENAVGSMTWERICFKC